MRFALACLPPPDRPIFLYALIACAMHTELTFIILAAPSLNRSGDLDRNSSDGADIQWEAVRALPMAGDVNLFMKGSRDEDDFEAEVEIMIAENAYRRRGFASSALQLMLSYATSSTSPSPLPISRDRLVVRIGEKNTPSIRLFEKLGFGITKRVEVFGEVEMRMGAGAVEWKEGERRVLRR